MDNNEYFLHFLQICNVFLMGAMICRWFMWSKFNDLSEMLKMATDQTLQISIVVVELDQRIKELEKK